MGITQNFYAVEKEDIIDDFDFSDNHGDKYGWSEIANFSKDWELYDWMYNLWKEKVEKVGKDSHKHEHDLGEEYLLLNQDDINRLEADFNNGKLKFDAKDKEVKEWLDERFREFLKTAKKCLAVDFVIYYEVR